MIDTELRLRVGNFDGPFDLLLHLCRTNEIDLAALPVRAITDQYLAHLEAIEFRDLETAGAYLVMAATLIYLKSKLLVPPDESDEELAHQFARGRDVLEIEHVADALGLQRGVGREQQRFDHINRIGHSSPPPRPARPGVR